MSDDHKRLMAALDKMVVQQKWQRMPRLKCRLKKKSTTKSGNLKLDMEKQTVYVLKRNNNLFRIADAARKSDVLSIAARRHLGRLYCTKVKNHGKINMHRDSDKQRTLLTEDHDNPECERE